MVYTEITQEGSHMGHMIIGGVKVIVKAEEECADCHSRIDANDECECSRKARAAKAA